MNQRWIPLLVVLASCSPSPDGTFSREAKPTATPAPAPDGDKTPADRGPQGAETEHQKNLEALGYLEPEDEPPAEERAKTSSRESGVDFGGRVFLSNDDSMSLASAQRVLWSVAEGRDPAASELRPHELLNYFSFDEPKIRSGETFGVGASAVRTEGGLSLALTITGARPARRPLDLVVLLDRSGSMEQDGRMTFVKRGLLRMVDRLRTGDRVTLVTFDTRVEVPLESFEVGRGDLDDLRLAIEDVTPRGRTDLDAGLERVYQLIRSHDDAGRDARVLVLTDAQLTAGDVNPSRVTEIGHAFDESRVRLAAIGVGKQFDDHVLQQLTEKGRGAYVYLGSDKVVDRVFGSGFDALVNVVADDVHFSLDLPDSLGMKRFYGEEMSRVASDVQPVSFYAGTTQVFLQDLEVAPGGFGKGDPLVLDLSWKDPATGKARTQRWEGTVGGALDGDRANVTKARALMAWTDLVRAGRYDCATEKAEWKTRARAFGGDVETRYLDGLVAGWCPQETGGAIAEAE